MALPKTLRPGPLAILSTALVVFALAGAPAALAGNGQEITGPSSDCQGQNCPKPTDGGGQASGPATDPTGGTEGTFADFER
ncbi:hypothetical protein [Rhodospira trueperi]|uniref:Uncharacterized protein n=1 Tax=Rhodospira trueperi TaxID=69960 RepID=A0A1G7AS61_9PROT|nr:hypothetical protein [Rhodospira trueperi]SDE17572.1 hypothetical protein SAMN05421720_10465 [Rhodospira trueperi]